MSLDINTWYSIQSFGTDYNLAILNSTSGGSVSSQSDGSLDNALWQVNPANGSTPSFLRTKQTGPNYCLSGAGGQLSITQCTGTDIWTIALFNGQNPGDGYYLAPGASSTTPRLREAETGNSVSLQEYTTSNPNSDVYFQWAFRSVSAINDGAYSTFPNGGFTSSTTSSSSSSSSISSISNSTTSSSSSQTTSTSTSISIPVETITHTADPTSTIAPETRTNTVIVTRSTTASPSPTASVSPSSVPPNAAVPISLSTRTIMIASLLSLAMGLNIF